MSLTHVMLEGEQLTQETLERLLGIEVEVLAVTYQDPSPLQALESELKALDKKCEKLFNVIDQDNCPDEEILNMQYYTMRSYQKILEERIRNVPNDSNF